MLEGSSRIQPPLPRNIVPFTAAYRTKQHPVALVFDFMEQFNLSKYIRNRPHAKKSEDQGFCNAMSWRPILGIRSTPVLAVCNV